MERYDQLAHLQRNWSPPPELAGSGERTVGLTGGGIALMVLAAALFLGGIAAGIAISRQSHAETANRDLLSTQGKDAEAVITRLWHSADKDNRSMVTYRFEVEGRIYSKSVTASRSLWKTMVVGAPLAVRFVPFNPTINRPRGWEESVAPAWLPYLVGLMLAGISAGLVFIVRRQMHLLSEGRPAPAVVTRYSSAQHGQKNIHFEFALLGGGMAKGRSGPVRKPLPAIGATVCVIYDRDNPSRNAVYPFDLVKVKVF
jgi:hypothetical protein